MGHVAGPKSRKPNGKGSALFGWPCPRLVDTGHPVLDDPVRSLRRCLFMDPEHRHPRLLATDDSVAGPAQPLCRTGPSRNPAYAWP